MKLFTAQQIREWDSFTIDHEHIRSIELMERAATKCVEWLTAHNLLHHSFTVFCGKGNNGGDGLALARLLYQRKTKVRVYILEFGHLGTQDFQVNLERLHQCDGVEIKFIRGEMQFPVFEQKEEIIIDALFGSGLNRPLEGVTSKLVEHINQSGCRVVSIDVPSGMPVDAAVQGGTIVKADDTLSFQAQKISFMMQQNAPFIGNVHVLDIGLAEQFYNSTQTNYEVVDRDIILSIYRRRDRFAHKGNFGHALIVAGSYGKMGAALLASKACVRGGAGLTTSHIPACGYEVLQTAVPEVMVVTDERSSLVSNIQADVSKFTCVGIGPGIGAEVETGKLLRQLFEHFKKPMVLDADALNMISREPELLHNIPSQSVLTPHPKEFERLFGKTSNDFERLQVAMQKARELSVVIVLKGHHTSIIAPGGKVYFNDSGNAGMAKGGSGDVLTGIITALICQKYDTIEAAILGVYIHGLAGDIAAERYSQAGMIASDIIDCLGTAFLAIEGTAEIEASTNQLS